MWIENNQVCSITSQNSTLHVKVAELRALWHERGMDADVAQRIAQFQAEMWHKQGGATNPNYQDTSHHILRYASDWGIWGTDRDGNTTDLRFAHVRDAIIEGLHLSAEKRVNLILYKTDGSIWGRLIRY